MNPKDTENQEKRLYYVILSVLLIAAAAVIVLALVNRKKPVSDAAETEEPETKVVYTEVEKFVEVEKEITVDTIEYGLQDMGKLITEEYYFTEVVTASSVKSIFSVEISITESSFVATYDGAVYAGVDFEEISVTKDDDAKTVTVTMPAASVFSVDIDTDSFQPIEEKNSVLNPFSFEDYNKSVSELEKTAREKAVEKGILTRADERAEEIISAFVTGLTGTDYRVLFVRN